MLNKDMPKIRDRVLPYNVTDPIIVHETEAMKGPPRRLSRELTYNLP
jgi:hypothetical protein